MTNPVRTFVAAVRFLTQLPLPGRPSTADEVAAGFMWHPLVGAAIGASIGGSYQLVAARWQTPIAAVCAVAVGLLITRGLHEDAFADAADGLGGGRTPEQIITIMKDSRIGAFGAIALWCLLTFRFAGLISTSDHAWVLFGLAAAWGRWTVVPFRRLRPLGSGLASGLGGEPEVASAAVATVSVIIISAGGAYFIDAPQVGLAGIAALAVAGAWMWYARHRAGGLNGDLMGAGNQLVEVAVLFALLA